MPLPCKQVNINHYLPVLQSLIAEGREVPMLITGDSMEPFLINRRDIIFIRKPQGVLRRGEMVFYQRESGQHVMHRIHHIDRHGNLFLVGDAQWEIEGPVLPQQVFGEIFLVKRDCISIKSGDFWWEFFEHVWIHMLPLRRTVLWLYRLLSH